MKKITHLKEKLTARCAYPSLWDAANCDDTRKPVSELGYFRCDNDGYRWYNTIWPVHWDVSTPDLIAEFDAVLDAFRRSFKDLAAMRKWCYAYAERCDGCDDEFNAYYEDVHGFYWFRMITRRGDYNLYLHCFSKATMQSDQNIMSEGGDDDE